MSHGKKAATFIGKILIVLVMLTIAYITVQNIMIFKYGMDNDCMVKYKFPLFEVDQAACSANK